MAELVAELRAERVAELLVEALVLLPEPDTYPVNLHGLEEDVRQERVPSLAYLNDHLVAASTCRFDLKLLAVDVGKEALAGLHPTGDLGVQHT